MDDRSDYGSSYDSGGCYRSGSGNGMIAPTVVHINIDMAIGVDVDISIDVDIPIAIISVYVHIPVNIDISCKSILRQETCSKEYYSQSEDAESIFQRAVCGRFHGKPLFQLLFDCRIKSNDLNLC